MAETLIHLRGRIDGEVSIEAMLDGRELINSEGQRKLRLKKMMTEQELMKYTLAVSNRCRSAGLGGIARVFYFQHSERHENGVIMDNLCYGSMVARRSEALNQPILHSTCTFAFLRKP